MRGPVSLPASIAWFRPMSFQASEPTLRTVVKPAWSVRCACATASTDQKRSLNCSPV
jgi:hypothetical protein